MRSSASSAAWLLVAAMATTGCPLYKTFDPAKTLSVCCFKFIGGPGTAATDSFFCDGKSELVMTECTSGCDSAFVVSIEIIRACACGLRRILPCNMPGRLVSAPYKAFPVTLS